MADDDKKIITFEGDQDPSDIIMEILEKNGINEDLEDWFNKTNQNEKTRFDFLYKITKSLAGKEITEIIFLTNIQQELNISEQTAKDIVKDIKEKLLPLTRIINKNEIENEAETPIKQPDQTMKPAEFIPEIKTGDIPLNIKDSVIEGLKKIPKKIETKNKITHTTQPNKTNDTYREPIN